MDDGPWTMDDGPWTSYQRNEKPWNDERESFSLGIGPAGQNVGSMIVVMAPIAP
jgi:hypothetical protein